MDQFASRPSRKTSSIDQCSISAQAEAGRRYISSRFKRPIAYSMQTIGSTAAERVVRGL
jgi:hypothetical protein